MILAIDSMDPVVAGMFFLVAVILFCIAAFLAWGAKALWATLVALGLAFTVFVFMWDRFALA